MSKIAFLASKFLKNAFQNLFQKSLAKIMSKSSKLEPQSLPKGAQNEPKIHLEALLWTPSKKHPENVSKSDPSDL